MKSPITSHVLDTEKGIPAEGIPVRLEQKKNDQWQEIAAGVTNDDGRLIDWMPKDYELRDGEFRVEFDLEEYFSKQNRSTFYPQAVINFKIENTKQHYHVPLLLSAFGFSTYRGS